MRDRPPFKNRGVHRLGALGAFAGLAVLCETAFYATLGPLLPSLESELGLSQSASGLLGAAYPAGMVLATIPAGLAADRIEPRATARVGIAALALASLAFGLGNSVAVVDTARLLQGAAAAAAWAGALAWLVGSSAADRRGAVLGATIAAAFAGTVLGPAVSVVADSAGREIVFVPLAVLLAAIAAWGGPRAVPHPRSAAAERPAVLRDRATVQGLLLMIVVGVLLGGVQTLGALFLADRGVATGVIAVVFIVGYGSQVVLTPIIGRQVDRTGPISAISVALAACGLALVLTPLVSTVWIACALLAVGTSASAAAYTPVAVLLSRIADARGFGQGMQMALTNGSWGVGAALGAVTLNVVAEGFGDVAAFGLAAAFCAIGLIALARTGVRTRFAFL